ncbi:hypothetical protein Cni_G22802 [Canna indica]|uniref:F-box domain-containing protein n=1 Tax=Canna indica TaxID=4628 RepID=A0AAQ3KRX5_9LILI|nr:hypothetical protein Cni_G22802 [Canna indica]
MSQQLIPGLPDDISRECLIRVAYRSFPAARSICRPWRRELDSPYFHRRRKSAGLSRSVLAFAQAESVIASGSSSSAAKSGGDTAPQYRIALFEPASGSWSRLPPVPGLPRGLPLFCRLAVASRQLVVVGGWDPHTWAASDGVNVYDFATGSWRRGAPMPGPRRSFFACASAPAVEGRSATVLVAGGHDEEKNALRSAMAYDVASDAWAALPDMATERDECRGVFLRGRFHVIGGYSTTEQGQFSRTAEALDVAAGRWGAAEDRLEEGTCPRTCVEGGDGRMYMCRGEVVQLAVMEGTGWRAVADVPGDARVAPQLVAWESGLMVMGSESHGGMQAGYVMEEGATAWRKVEVPEEYSGHVHAGCSLEI